MLARSGPLPARGGWAYEVKWDGFRCLVSTEDGFRARSRRGWNMTTLVLELADLPERGVFYGELVAWGDDGRPRSSSSAGGSCTATRRSRSAT